VYNIGIDVRQGRGRYCETNIVTFTPRYQLDNQSSHKLAYAQRHYAAQHVCTFFTFYLSISAVNKLIRWDLHLLWQTLLQ